MANPDTPTEILIMRGFDEAHQLIGEYIDLVNSDPDEATRQAFLHGPIARSEAVLSDILSSDLQSENKDFRNAAEFVREFLDGYVKEFDPRDLKAIQDDVDFANLNAKRMDMLSFLHEKYGEDFKEELDPIMQRELPTHLVQVSVPDFADTALTEGVELDLEAALDNAQADLAQNQVQEPAPQPEPETNVEPSTAASAAEQPEEVTEEKPSADPVPQATSEQDPSEAKPSEAIEQPAQPAADAQPVTPKRQVAVEEPSGQPSAAVSEPSDAAEEARARPANENSLPEDGLDDGPGIDEDDMPEIMDGDLISEPHVVQEEGGRPDAEQKQPDPQDLAHILSNRIQSSVAADNAANDVGDIYFHESEYTRPLRFVLETGNATSLERIEAAVNDGNTPNQDDVIAVGKTVLAYLKEASNQIKKSSPFDNPYGPLRAALKKSIESKTLTVETLSEAIHTIDDMDSALMDVKPVEAVSALNNIAAKIKEQVPSKKERVVAAVERLQRRMQPALDKVKNGVTLPSLVKAASTNVNRRGSQALQDFLAHYPNRQASRQDLISPTGKDLGRQIKNFSIRQDGATETQLGSLLRRSTIVDNNSHLSFFGKNNSNHIALLAEQAKRKGWAAVRLHGLSADQKSEAFIQMSLSGLRVDGYQPTDAEMKRLNELRKSVKQSITIESPREPDLRVEPTIAAM